MGARKRCRIISDDDVIHYVARKAQKQAMNVAKKLKLQCASAYANDSNPFGDPNLYEKFVWRKKIEREVARGASLDTFSLKAEKKRQRERIEEIEKGKKRRESRAIEKAQREEEMALSAKERARLEFQDWEKKEKEFLFDQGKTRPEIRLLEGCGKPMDILINQLNPSNVRLDIEVNEPYSVFEGLTVNELQELQEDINLHLGLDGGSPLHYRYWGALLVVCDWELAEARKKDAIDRGRMRGEQVSDFLLFAEGRGMHSSIEADVMNLLEGKTYAELEAQQSRIESNMRSGEAKVVEFWETLLIRIRIFKAKALLKEIGAQVLRRHLEHLEKPLVSTKPDDPNKIDAQVVHQEPESQEEIEAAAADDGEEGSYSPELLHGDDNESAIDPEIDRAILEKNRISVLEERHLKKTISRRSPYEDSFEKQASKAMGDMGEGDAAFGPK